MIIRFDTNEPKIEIISRNNMILRKQEKIVDVGAKTLPINLGDVFHKAYSFVQSNFVTSSVYISTNKEIDDENNIIENIYTPNVTKITIDEIKNRAKNNLVDLHFFPVKYKNGNTNKEMAYVDYNLRKSLTVMIEMEQSLQWLIGYNENVQFIIENRDVEKTLWSVANRLSDNKEIKTKCVNTALEIYSSLDVKYIASKYNDFWWNVDMFIGKERYMKNITNYENYDKNSYIGVYVYGAKREDAWRNITHKYDSSLCLYVDNQTKMMLKRIKNTMTGQQFHKFLDEMIGKWFDLNDKKIWDAIRQNMKRIDDSNLDKMYDVGVCRMAVKSYFEEMGNLCYNGELYDNSTDQEMAQEANDFYSNIDTHEETDMNVLDQENTNTDEIIDNQYTKMELPKELQGLSEKDFWATLSA